MEETDEVIYIYIIDVTQNKKNENWFIWHKRLSQP
jgi:hypothetical protein